MIACINDEIVGFVSYTQIPDNKERAILDVLLVKKEYRGQYIGDGLVKAILNLAEKRGIKRVYCIKDEKNSLFFKKVGFTIRTGTDLEFIKKYIHNHIQSDKRLLIFEAKLPEFFNKPCRSNL
jgi:amino-acid N-acetyltransferase